MTRKKVLLLMSKLFKNLNSPKLELIRDAAKYGEINPAEILENLGQLSVYLAEMIPSYQMAIDTEEKRLNSHIKKLKKSQKQQEIVQKIMYCCKQIEKVDKDTPFDWNRELKSLLKKYFVESDSESVDDEDDE